MLDIAVYGVPVALLVLVYARLRSRSAAHHLRRLEKSREEGAIEPASLHPVIDPLRCLGCGACYRACPEGDVLGIVEGKAQLIAPANCIGHGACRRACPFDAIELVFGTEKRGVDIPHVSERFESNVPGLFIAGELGGMGLVANAVEQGCQAVEYIARGLNSAAAADRETFDLVIVGAGPAGIAASLKARQLGLNFVTLEQDSLGGSVSHFPRHKIVMTRPVTLPIYGRLKHRKIEKEQLIELWRKVVDDTGIAPIYGARVVRAARDGDGFSTTTEAGACFRSRRLLLAMGRRGTPRRLEVPGEERAKVMYKLVDPEQYANSRILVVGGGDSAVEAALALSKQPGALVALSYRGSSITRAKPENRERFRAALEAGAIRALFESRVLEIREHSVVVETPAGPDELANDWVLVSAGGVLPTAFLHDAGVEVRTWKGALPA